MTIFAVKENPNKSVINKSENPETGNQDHWAKSLEAVSAETTGILKAFGEPRYLVIKRIKEANLIGPRSATCTLEDYLDNPLKYLTKVKTEAVHVFVEPKQGISRPRIRLKDMSIKKTT